MEQYTVEEIKERLEDLIRSSTRKKQQFTITSKEGNFVVLPEETYNNILVTLEFLSTPGLMDNVNIISSSIDDEVIESFPQATNH